MNELALFAGEGGGLLATKWLLGWRTVCYVENARYPTEVLKARIRDGLLDDAPIWDDVRTFDGRPWCGCVDIVTAGFLCQPFSSAGRMLADRDDRNLWPDTIRIIREVEPKWILLENVPGLLAIDYVATIFGELAQSGYDARWDVLSAAAIGAAQIRDRLWIVGWRSDWDRILANRDNGRFSHKDDQQCGKRKILSGTKSLRGRPNLPRFSWWTVEPKLGRLADGVPDRVERGRTIANAQVPAVAAVVWELLTQYP